MRRSLILMTVLILLIPVMAAAAGEEDALRGWSADDGYVYVTLGRYPQTIDGGGQVEKMGWKWYSKKTKVTREDAQVEPILWRVLTADDEKAYLCSEYILFAMPMHRDYNAYAKFGGDFAQTELCAYLNGEFASDAFTEDEMSMLAECGTYGKVFLLGSEDVKNKEIGMGTNPGRKQGLKAYGTEYSIRVTKSYVFEPMNGSHGAYWVRDPSTSDARHARCTKHDGSLGHIIADRANEGVRPAVYLASGTWDIAGGSGTKDDPYQLIKKR